MKTPAENSRQAVDRFLGKLGDSLPPLEVEGAIGRVYSRLDDAEALGIPANTPQSVTSFRWSPVAAAILAMLIGGAVQLLFLRPSAPASVAKAVSGQVYFVESYSPLSIASRIEGGQLVRAGSEGGAIGLLDGSRIEMSPQAELAIVQDDCATAVADCPYWSLSVGGLSDVSIRGQEPNRGCTYRLEFAGTSRY